MKFEPKLYHLSNGVTVILDPMDIETTHVKINFYTGARDEKPNEYGITHFCEHMLFKGTKRFPTKREITDFLEYNGGTTNGLTTENKVSLYGRIIADNLNLLLDILGDQINNSLFDEKAIDKERSVIIDELNRSKNSKQNNKIDFIQKTLFDKFVPDGMPVTGNVENISSFSREQLLEFIKRRFSAKNCVIAISGKIKDIDKTIEQLECLFGGLSAHDVPQNRELTYYPSVAHNPDLKTDNVKLHIFFPSLLRFKPEYMFNNTCVGFFENYLMQELKQILRYENGLLYGLDLLRYGNEEFMLNAISTETSSDRIAKVVELIAKTSHKIYTNCSITDKDINKFVCHERLSNADFLESSSARASRLLGVYYNYGILYDYYQDIKMAESTTADDVIKYSRGYFDGDMSIITQGAKVDADLKQIWIDNFK